MSTVASRFHPMAGFYGQGESVRLRTNSLYLSKSVGASRKTQLTQAPGPQVLSSAPWGFSFLSCLACDWSCLFCHWTSEFIKLIEFLLKSFWFFSSPELVFVAWKQDLLLTLCWVFWVSCGMRYLMHSEKNGLSTIHKIFQDQAFFPSPFLAS